MPKHALADVVEAPHFMPEYSIPDYVVGMFFH
jgi:hypothetical protein